MIESDNINYVKYAVFTLRNFMSSEQHDKFTGDPIFESGLARKLIVIDERFKDISITVKYFINLSLKHFGS